MSNWLSLINLGIDAAQSYQIHKARRQLSQLEATAAAESRRQEILEMLRNFIFEVAQDVKGLEAHLQDHPQSVFVVAYALRWRLQETGISPEVFSEFHDKEYAQQVQVTIESLIEDSQSRLSQGQLKEARSCFDAITQMPLLDQAIEASSCLEQLQATETEWQGLASQAKRGRMLQALGGTLMGVITVAGVVLACVIAPISSTLHEIFFYLFFLGAPLVVLAGIIGGVVLLVLGTQAVPSGHAQLKRARLQWRSKLMSQKDWEQAIALFGQRNSEEYQELRTTRENLISTVLGQVEGIGRLLHSGS
jgi:hypothetical protein